MSLSQWLSDQPTYLLWLVGGLLGLAINVLIFEPTVAALSIAAIITAIAALTIANVTLQILIWAILAVTMALLLRGFVPSRTAAGLEEPTRAEVCADIPRGGVGEVSYEGSYWSARCQISDVAIAAGHMVHVVGREGNTLIVMPIPTTHPVSRDRASY